MSPKASSKAIYKISAFVSNKHENKSYLSNHASTPASIFQLYSQFGPKKMEDHSISETCPTTADTTATFDSSRFIKKLQALPMNIDEHIRSVILKCNVQVKPKEEKSVEEAVVVMKEKKTMRYITMKKSNIVEKAMQLLEKGQTKTQNLTQNQIQYSKSQGNSRQTSPRRVPSESSTKLMSEADRKERLKIQFDKIRISSIDVRRTPFAFTRTSHWDRECSATISNVKRFGSSNLSKARGCISSKSSTDNLLKEKESMKRNLSIESQMVLKIQDDCESLIKKNRKSYRKLNHKIEAMKKYYSRQASGASLKNIPIKQYELDNFRQKIGELKTMRPTI